MVNNAERQHFDEEYSLKSGDKVLVESFSIDKYGHGYKKTGPFKILSIDNGVCKIEPGENEVLDRHFQNCRPFFRCGEDGLIRQSWYHDEFHSLFPDDGSNY